MLKLFTFLWKFLFSEYGKSENSRIYDKKWADSAWFGRHYRRKMEIVGAWNTGRADVTRENLAKLFSAGMYFDEAFGDEIKLEKRPEIADEEIKDTAA